MIDASAIKALGDLAVAASNAAYLGTFTPALFHDGKLISIEHLQAGRARFRGKLTTASLADFVGYVRTRAHRATPAHGFIDADALKATCIFNVGDEASPGHADDLAILALKPTAAYSAVRGIDGQRLSQKALAEFMEDWLAYVTPASESGETLSLAAAVAAVRSVMVKHVNESTNTVRNFGATRSALEEIEAQATGEAKLPPILAFRFTPYLGLSEQVAELRIAIIADETKPTFSVRWARRERVEESIAQDFKRLLIEEIGDAASLTIGTFTP